MTKTPAPSDSRYFGAKPSQNRSPVSASTSAPSSNEVFRRNARNRAIAGHRFMGRLLSLLRTHWDHEPEVAPLSLPSPRQTGRGWPKAGRGVVHGKPGSHGIQLPQSRGAARPGSPDVALFSRSRRIDLSH